MRESSGRPPDPGRDRRRGGEDREASRTTPEAPDVQQLLSEMLEHGARSAVMEVSSHALSLKRVDGMRFAAAVFD